MLILRAKGIREVTFARIDNMDIAPKAHTGFNLRSLLSRLLSVSGPAPAPELITKSPSVTKILERIGDEPITAPYLAERLCRLHENYYNAKFGMAAQPLSQLKSTTIKGSETWLREIRGLISEQVMDYLDTAAVALGLALIDGRIFGIFNRIGVIDALIDELTKNIMTDTERDPMSVVSDNVAQEARDAR